MRFVVGPASSIPPGTKTIVYPAGEAQGIGVFNVDGVFYALRNVCPHMGAPLCYGPITGTAEARQCDDGPPEIDWVQEGEVVSCPWHHWEFEIKTGRTIFPSKNRVRRFPVTVEPGDVEARLRAGVPTYPVGVEDSMVVLDLS
jgi:nitrite reductase/ring-hydroxylating ferredoxin subunit